jgi:hypothetical protein
MKFNLIQPVGCGNAVRIIVEQTHGEQTWRVLRKESVEFAGPNDPAAFLVYEGPDRNITDARMLVNGVTYYYALYGYINGGLSSLVAIHDVVPNATFDDLSVDAQEIIRDRLDTTLNSMILRGKLAISKSSIAVTSIPFYSQGSELPVVTVLFSGGSSSIRGMGDLIAQNDFVGDACIDSQGWLSAVSLDVTAWSLNAAERNSLRRGLEAALAANLSVFDDLGLQMLEVNSVQDMEDMQSMNVPVYQTIFRLGCTVAVAVTDEYSLITDVLLQRPAGSSVVVGGVEVTAWSGSSNRMCN